MTRPLNDLSAFQRDLLIAIARIEPCNGQRVCDELEAAGYDEVYNGRLYPNLRKLNSAGLVDYEYRDGRSKTLTVTSAGESAVMEYAQWVTSALDSTAPDGGIAPKSPEVEGDA